jgi:hypothetical protein
VALLLTSGISAFGEKQPKNWMIGRVLDESRARYFAGMLNNSSSQSSENGTLSGNATSTSYGDSTDTTMNGNYSGTKRTTTSGNSIAVYRVYDNLVIEGEDAVYITSERLRWRWSKGAHVAVNGAVCSLPPSVRDYWLFRVKLSGAQAILGFPKFGTIGVGFAKETDWNTNLPYSCPTENIFNHIKHNKGRGNIKNEDCLKAIRMVQEAAAKHQGRNLEAEMRRMADCSSGRTK